MSLSTECVAAFLSLRYPSYMFSSYPFRDYSSRDSFQANYQNKHRRLVRQNLLFSFSLLAIYRQNPEIVCLGNFIRVLSTLVDIPEYTIPRGAITFTYQEGERDTERKRIKRDGMRIEQVKRYILLKKKN